MSLARRPVGGHTMDDPVIGWLCLVMCGAPVVLAATMGWQAVARGPAKLLPAPRIEAVSSAPSTPVMTQAILRPGPEGRLAEAPAPKPFTERVAAAGMAPLPAPAPLPPLAMPRDEMTTASMPSPARRAERPGARGWRVETLRNVEVAEGLRLVSGGATLVLAGVEPLEANATCTRLDGVTEACAARAASRLEILLRGRTVTCRVFEPRDGETPVGRCRADKIDLADDLVKNGLARRGA